MSPKDAAEYSFVLALGVYFFAHGGGELLEEGALFGGHFGGNLYLHENMLIAAAAAAKVWDALAAQHEFLAALGAFRNLDLLRAAYDRHFDRSAQRRPGKADLNLAIEIIVVPLEDRVLFDDDDHVA